jgi:hypothetical protein
MITRVTRPNRRNRRNQRGAALVEAAVVIPVMLVFLGVIMFTHRSYTAKMDKQWGTRSGVMYYASHACKGDVPASVVPAVDDGAADGLIPASAADKNSGKIGGSNSPGATAGLQRSNTIVTAVPPADTVYGSAVQDRTRVQLQRQISAASEVACNEETFPSKWTAVFSEIGSLWKSKGGLAK